MPSGTPRPLPSRALSSTGPVLLPQVFLRKGAWVFPVEGDLARTALLLDPQGTPVDVFDATDHLFAKYHRIYVVDIEGVRFRRPQFEFLQELAQGKEMWVDAGPRNVDEVMDVIVAGGTRAVVSTRTVQSAREIPRALKVTSQIALEIVVAGGRVVATDPDLAEALPGALAREARGQGIAEIILSFDDGRIDWELGKEISVDGPTYLGSPFTEANAPLLASFGLSGGIFSAQGVLNAWTTSGS
jgi:phosphoribosylformimino-5-aminoimidazole carboxamide ribonucleotide (ProFAR) isomerase